MKLDLKQFGSILTMGLLFNLAVSSSSFATQVSKKIQDILVKNKVADILIYLKSDGELEIPFFIPNGVAGHAERVKYVATQLRNRAQDSQVRVVEILDQKKVHYQAFYIVNAIHIEYATRSIIQEIANLPEVDRIELNFRSNLKLPRKIAHSGPVEKPFSIASGIEEIRADKVWNELKIKGQGIVIASADGGAEWMHSAIKTHYRGYSPLFVNHDYYWHDAIHRGGGSGCPANSSSPCDETSHGTHTIGTMIGDDNLGNQIGVAPDAKWISCRNMDRGNGTLATYIECFEFFLAPYPFGGNPRIDGRPEMAPHIINNSWSCPSTEGCKAGDLVDVVKVMKAAGIMVVVAAGNDGDQCGSLQDPPGTYSGDVVSVAAYNRYVDDIAYFSSRGPSGFSGLAGIDITAPGVGIRSSVIGNKYEELDGTSMASPHVAATIALLWSYRPQLVGQIDKTVQLIRGSASPTKSKQSCGSFAGDQIPNAVFGYGRLDAYNLLKQAEALAE